MRNLSTFLVNIIYNIFGLKKTATPLTEKCSNFIIISQLFISRLSRHCKGVGCVETNVLLFIFASCFCRHHYLSANPLHLNCKFINVTGVIETKSWLALIKLYFPNERLRLNFALAIIFSTLYI